MSQMVVYLHLGHCICCNFKSEFLSNVVACKLVPRVLSPLASTGGGGSLLKNRIVWFPRVDNVNIHYRTEPYYQWKCLPISDVCTAIASGMFV